MSLVKCGALAIFLLAASAAEPLSAQPAAARRPHVVVVVLDDAGFADIGSFGGDIRTPRLDGLAAEGLRYTQFHTTGLCSPSRAALLTGRNHHTVGMRTIANFATMEANNLGRITPHAATLAEMLKENGYSTLAVGKWHLAPLHETTPGGPFDNWPLGKGFERFYGFLDGGTDQWKPELAMDNSLIDPPRRPGYHLTEDLVDKAIGFVQQQQSSRPDRPFFLYLSLAAPHAPHQAPPEFIKAYAGQFKDGWDSARVRRLEKMRQLGIVPPGTQLAAANPAIPRWETLSPQERALYERFQEVYAGFMTHADAHLGRLFDALRDLGVLDESLVFVMSDNGASQEGGLLGSTNIIAGANGERPTLAANLAQFGDLGGHAHSNYPLGWSQASNTPFPRYKQNVHFGGVRDPLIVRWPAGIAERGGIRSQFHHLIDVVPTVLDVAGLQAPTVLRGVSQLPIDGTSMRYSFSAPGSASTRTTQYFEMYGHRGLYHEGWKAVTYHEKGTPFEQDRWELYHVAEDFSESRNLAAQRPEKLRELVAIWEREARARGVHPLDDRTVELRHVAKLGAPNERLRWVLYPGTPVVNTNAAPDTKDRSYVIRAEVEIPRAGAEGVLAAHGDMTGGWTLFVRDGKLVHEYNRVGERFRLVSAAAIPVGTRTLEYRFTRTGRLTGVGRLFIDGRPVGEVQMRTLPNVLSYEGLSVGRDALNPVSPSYTGRGEFPFSGRLQRVVIELGSS